MSGLLRILILTGVFGLAGLCGEVDAQEKVDSPSAVALTQTEQKWLKSHPDITFTYADSFEPQLIVNPDGSYSGILPDLVNELNRRLGTGIKRNAYPATELPENVQVGEKIHHCAMAYAEIE